MTKAIDAKGGVNDADNKTPFSSRLSWPSVLLKLTVQESIKSDAVMMLMPLTGQKAGIHLINRHPYWLSFTTFGHGKMLPSQKVYAFKKLLLKETNLQL